MPMAERSEARVPTASQGLENREKNNGQGKVRDFFLFWAKSKGIFLQNGSMPRFLSNIKNIANL